MQHPFPPESNDQAGEKRFYLRVSWIILSGILLLVFLACANEFIDYQTETNQLRQSLETSEILQTQAIMQVVQQPVIAQDWAAVTAEFVRLEKFFAGAHFMLISPSGTILANNQKDWPRSPILPNNLLFIPPTDSPAQPNQPALPNAQVRWLSPDQLLLIAVPVLDDQGRLIAILVTQTDYKARFDQFNRAKTTSIFQFLLLIFAILVLFLLINGLLFVRPLNQIYRLSRAITQGSGRVRASDSPVLELQRVNTAFNEMVDHLADQRTSLEYLNRSLEDTVAERTAALEKTNAAIQHRAEQLEAINTLIAATNGALDMPTLIEQALQQSMQLVQVECGSLWVSGYATSAGIPKEAGQLISQAFKITQWWQDQNLVIPDWSLVPENDPLAPTARVMHTYQLKSSLSLPIFANGSFAGLLNLASFQPRTWSPDEVSLLEIVVHHLGTATERTQSIDGIRSHNHLMSELIDQSERLNRNFTMKEVIATIGEGTLALSKADRLAIFLRKTGPQVECPWLHGLTPQFIESAQAYIREQLTNQGTAERKSLLFSDLHTSEVLSSNSQLARLGNFRAAAIWPLVYGNRTIAFVCCFYNQPTHWDKNLQEILGTFCRQAAVAIENSRLYEAECAQRQLAEGLRDVTATLTSTLDLDEVLEGILNSLGKVVPHDSANIMLLEGEFIRPVRWSHLPDAYKEAFKSWRYSIRDLRNRQKMVDTVQAMVIPDTAQDPFWVRTTGLEWVRSYAGAPICQRGEVTGFIDVMSAQPDFYHQETGPILQAFAYQAAIALENARLYHNTQLRMAETSALYRAIQPLFAQVEDIVQLARQITQSVTQEFASAHCSILLINESRTHLVMLAQSGSLQLNSPDLPLNGPGLTVRAVRSGKVIYSPDVTQEPNYVLGADISRSELAIPLLAGNEVIGILNLESPEINAFDERGQRLLASFAEQAALGLENARLFATIRQNATQMTQLSKTAQRRAQEAETLREATAALISTLDLKTLLARILDHLEQVIPYDSACVFLIEDEEHLRVQAAKNLVQGDRLLFMRFPRNNLLFKEIERGMRPYTLPDAQNDPRFQRWGGTEHIHGWMGVPMTARNEFVGILTMDRIECNAFKSEEMALAQVFANQAAVAVQNARLYESIQQRARELEALHTATTSLVSTLDLQKLLERILASAASAIPSAKASALHLLNEGQLRLRVHQGLQVAQIQSPEWNGENRLWTWVLQEQRPLLISKNGTLPNGISCEDLPAAWKGCSLLLAPLIQEEQPLGTIALISPEPNAFEAHDLHLLISFASTATAAIHNAQLHSAIQYLAVTDPLTQVYNRRGFFDLAQHLLEEAQYFDRPISAIMLDIDYFKRINDQHGHDAGDNVLRKLAERCRKALRESDIICRYGGEEFAILLPESDLPGAQAAAQRLHRMITETPIETAAGPVSVTVSVGIAAYHKDCGSLDQLLKWADNALYVAKRQGRNRVSAWAE